MRRRAALAVAACLVLASCSTSGDDAARGSDRGDRSTTTTTDRSGIDRSTTTTTQGRPPTGGEPSDGGDPLPPDVPDRTFEGLGDPRIDVQRYDVVVRADPGKEAIRGSVDLELRSRVREPLTSFTLDLRGPKVTAAPLSNSAPSRPQSRK